MYRNQVYFQTITLLVGWLVRILAASKYNARTSPLFKQLNLIKVSDMYKIQEIKL